MANNRYFNARTAEELDAEIRDIFALEAMGRGDEMCRTLHIDYQDEAVKTASLVPQLTARGINIVWLKKSK